MASGDSESTGWGPKTTEPLPDQIYSSDKLREIIDVDAALSPSQRDTLYKVVEQNQTTFSFDSQLGHLPSKVHIMLAPDTKPISMPCTMHHLLNTKSLTSSWIYGSHRVS